MFFFQLILQKELHVVYALSNVCGQDRTLLAGILLKIFLHEKLESLLLRTLNDREISMEGTALNPTKVFWNSGQLGRKGFRCCLVFFSSFSCSLCQRVTIFFLCFWCHLFSVFLFPISFFRWSYYLVPCHHFSEHTYGAVYESHSNKFCSSCAERFHFKDHGEQAVLWGDTLNCVFLNIFGLLTQ